MANKLTTIYYHDIVETGKGWSYQKTDISFFEKQMNFLSENNYHSLLFDDLSINIPEKAILITFDDGFRSIYEMAAPIMNKYKMKGNVFLATRFVDKDSDFLTWEMVRELQETGMFSFGAHTHNHVDIRSLSESDFVIEMNQCDFEIKKRLNYRPIAFCMPYGKYDSASIRSLLNSRNYLYIFASHYGQATQPLLQNKLIPRIGIQNEDTQDIFKKKIDGRYNWKGYFQRIRLSFENILKKRVTCYQK